MLGNNFDIPLEKLHARLLSELALRKNVSANISVEDKDLHLLKLPEDLPPPYEGSDPITITFTSPTQDKKGN